MTLEIALVLMILMAMLGLLVFTRIAPDAILVAALTGMLALPVPDPDAAGGWKIGMIGVQEGLSGFSNPGMLTVGVLFVVVAGLRETGSVDWLASKLLGRPRSERRALVRVFAPVCTLSVFLNNTPVVAMMIPAVQDWAKKLSIEPSRLLLPLSYAAILGGTCSLIGTSTNLVVDGLVREETNLEPLGMFTITAVGLPVAILGFVFLLFAGPKLLPKRESAGQALDDPREYTLELMVPEGSPIAGKSVDEAGLRSLPGCFLIEIEREGRAIAPVAPDEVLEAGDRLLFAGVVESIRDLVNTRGLEVATDQVFKLDSPRYRRRLYEVVVAPACSLTGTSIRASRFRNRYTGAVIAVARNGERIRGKIGDIELQGGDLLLVEGDGDFLERARSSRDFLLVRSLDDSTPRRHTRAPLAVGIMAAMVVVAASGFYNLLVAAMLAAGAMILTRCCTITEGRQAVDWSVLIVIGASLGIGEVMDASGTAEFIADGVIGLVGTNPWIMLTAVYVITAVLTAVISNNAAVALMFGIAQAVAEPAGVNFMPFVIVIMMAGSASFATPIGYQTNLMVMGPGGYSFNDFLRIGIPMTILAGAATIILTPLFFSF